MVEKLYNVALKVSQHNIRTSLTITSLQRNKKRSSKKAEINLENVNPVYQTVMPFKWEKKE